MSLLEDVFLQDEAGEAQELERVIEGDDYNERPRPDSPDSNENSEKEDEAEEEKRRVDPIDGKTKRVVKNPRFILNPARLTGPRGLQVIPDHFKDFKFKGKGNEKEDLDMVLKKLEHWAYRLYPKFKFEDCLKKIETLGKKRPVITHLHKIRSDQLSSEETVVQRDSSDDEPAPMQEEDEFDKLLQQQIDLARNTPGPGSVRKPIPDAERSPVSMPKATSSPSISEELRERILRNKKLAEERRLTRIKENANKLNNSETDANTDTGVNTSDNTVNKVTNIENIEGFHDNDAFKKKHKRSNVIDTSDDECVISSNNQSVTIDVHSHKNNDNQFDVNDDLEMIQETPKSINNDNKVNDIEPTPEIPDSGIADCNTDSKTNVNAYITNTGIDTIDENIVNKNSNTEIIEDNMTDNFNDGINNDDLVADNDKEASIQTTNENTEEIKEKSQNQHNVVDDLISTHTEGVMDVDF